MAIQLLTCVKHFPMGEWLLKPDCGLLTKYCGPAGGRKEPFFIHQPDKVQCYYSHNVTRCMGSVEGPLKNEQHIPEILKKKAADQKQELEEGNSKRTLKCLALTPCHSPQQEALPQL